MKRGRERRQERLIKACSRSIKRRNTAAMKEIPWEEGKEGKGVVMGEVRIGKIIRYLNVYT